ncbi:zinc-dependent alcohol dehydrogenase family protein [Lichenifustis flavocetrariae]|uniref:NAD(P)-dependent alcohol dehydrogenase n=1 Tax=Lichenifustis flavocetrariae TaxID=2949735 RepID=A0AA41YZX0_9HYPH|nr:NAD(P)-dependent alcohol dehydrogenase [Lichenifustis flavocetrariae]MCW6511646.1 NAD(P)-dependent alcohol dehydrogenase [Lichenifustis flavocetrariae]
MKAFNIIETGKGLDSWSRVDLPDPTPGPGQVSIRVKAVSLNTRDLMVMGGYFPIPPKQNAIPVSDGAGEIVAVGAGVTRWNVGDRVFGSYYQQWPHGQFPADAELHALGGPLDGMLAELVTLSESGVVRVPDHLSYEEASTLPVAALTAWNAVMESGGRMTPGATVLTLGTGGVSLFAIQLAQASGFRVIATTSSQAKAERLRALGVSDVVNYKHTPNWEQEVLRLTNGQGVDQVIEVGGTGTLPKSLRSVRSGGLVNLIGLLTGFNDPIDTSPILFNKIRLQGSGVGSVQTAEVMARTINAIKLKPVVSDVFDFENAKHALAKLQDAATFGKVIIRIN